MSLKHQKGVDAFVSESRQDSADKRADAKDTAFLAQQLEQVEAEIYKQEYPDLLWRSILPIKNSGLNPGAASFAYFVYDWFGQARFLSSQAQDLGSISIAGEKFVSKVETVGHAFDYTIDELLAAQMSGFPIESEKALYCGEAIERKMDEAAAKGDPEFGFQGALGLSGVTIDTTAANGVASATTWASKLALTDGTGPSKIVADLHTFLNGMVVASKGKIRPDRLVLPQSLLSIMQTTLMSDVGRTDATILSTFLKTSPFIKSESQIFAWYHAETAAANGHSRIMAFKADRRYMEVYVPKEIDSLPAQPKGLRLIVPMYAKFGGVVLRMPLSVRYLDGAD